MITIQTQNFGVEIELTGITRQAAAQVIADYYGTIGTRFMGTVYKTYEAVDSKGRRWKCMRDASSNALSREVSGLYICDDCGSDEALRAFAGLPLPLEEWEQTRLINRMYK